jgi:DNA replication protein DnaC
MPNQNSPTGLNFESETQPIEALARSIAEAKRRLKESGDEGSGQVSADPSKTHCHNVFDLLPAKPGAVRAPVSQAVSETRQGKCSIHGPYIAKRVSLLGGMWTSCPTCVAEAAERRLQDDVQRAQQIRQSQAEDRMQDLLASSGVPKRYRNAQLQTFGHTATYAQRRTEAARLCGEVVDRIAARERTVESVAILGGYHIGKTHLACAMVRHALERGLSARYETVGRFIRQVKDGWSADRPLDLSVYTQSDLLVLDEVGTGLSSDFDRSLFLDLIDRRYQDCRPTVFVSNLTPTDFYARMGDRVMAKILDDGLIFVDADWDSYADARLAVQNQLGGGA